MLRRSKRAALIGIRLAACALLAAAAAPGLASDDWDWDAVEAIDDAPVTKTPAAGAPAKTDATAPAAPRAAENALPDFAAEPVTVLAMFDGVAPFEVVPSQRDDEMHPCANCHQWATSNPEPRRLLTPHDNFELQHGLHGKGGFWCFTCHDVDNNFSLKTLEGEPVEFAHAYVVCSQCHAQQARDWAHGAHGKRVGNWQGRRQVFNCTACHYQHRPALKPREPLPGPTMRVGLPRPDHWVAAGQRPDHGAERQRDWQRDIERRRESVERDDTSDTAASGRVPADDAES
ncbi:MAG: hypothetical protein QNJ91_05170 [Gammaproteobacteria bacterium]|nr:hypothetical protein [Gammaproteobacteria bacterium]